MVYNNAVVQKSQPRVSKPGWHHLNKISLTGLSLRDAVLAHQDGLDGTLLLGVITVPTGGAEHEQRAGFCVNKGNMK